MGLVGEIGIGGEGCDKGRLPSLVDNDHGDDTEPDPPRLRPATCFVGDESSAADEDLVSVGLEDEGSWRMDPRAGDCLADRELNLGGSTGICKVGEPPELRWRSLGGV